VQANTEDLTDPLAEQRLHSLRRILHAAFGFRTASRAFCRRAHNEGVPPWDFSASLTGFCLKPFLGVAHSLRNSLRPVPPPRTRITPFAACVLFPYTQFGPRRALC
jgi:hypothetical protein